MAKKKIASDGMKIRGFYRVQIRDDADGTLGGDSGWQENTVTNLGVQNFLLQWIGAGSGGSQVTYMALGTGGAPIATDTTLAGELADSSTSRAAVTSSIVSSRTIQFTAAFNSAASFVTASKNISNVGLFATSTTQAGTLFAGNTYASSAVATNQSVQVTYQIRLS